MNKFSIAVDGPAGSGKSTVAKAVAKKLGIIYVDTGAMYRSVAYYCMQKGISTADEDGVLSVLEDIHMEIQPEEDGQRIFLNGKDVTLTIRTQEIGQGASDVGKIQSVREKLGQMQRQMAEVHSVIMDGRDIGTYVLPDAAVKIYMDASVEERAKRRRDELMQKGETLSMEAVRAEIMKRDENDINRKHNPLRQAADAVYLDTTALAIDQVVEKILEIVAQKVK